MRTSNTKPFRILWIEYELEKIEAGQIELVRLLKSKSGLNRKKIEIIPAGWVNEAVEKLDAMRKNPPDLIILDFMLPRTEEQFNAKPPKVDTNAGFLLWHRLRQQIVWGTKMQQVPIIFVTALSRPVYRPMMESDSELKWLEKPVFPSEIAKVIKQRIETGSF